MGKAKQWAEAFALAVDSYEETRATAQAVINRAEIVFSNRSRLVAIPANPNTARGYSANLILDEFAFHDQPAEIWRAIYPSISNPLRGQKKLRIVSTPNGRANMFYELWTKNSHYSKHKVTIYDAVADGLPVNVEELKAGIDDPDAWAQEYLCEFLDAGGVLLPYELIAPCEAESAAALEGAPAEFVGIDIGRKSDLSVLWRAALLGDVLPFVEVREFAKCEFHAQLDAMREVCARPEVRGVAVDATGIGAMLAEELRRSCGGKVEEFAFTASSKAELYQQMRRRFEERTVRVPVSRAVREDLHALVKSVSTSGQVRYSADRNADGHSDRAAALALCIRAATAASAWVPLPAAARRRNHRSAA